MTSSLKQLIGQERLVLAPLVLNGMSAKLAEQSGFEALYVGGGALGNLKAVTEASLSLTDLIAVAVEVRTVCRLPLIMDGACGWGDPMHMVRTIAMAEAAGYGGIEIEDQLFPKRAHHHIGREHPIPTDLMVAKIAEAVATRTNPDFLIIARTNAIRTDNVDEAVRRCLAYKEAGADVLFPIAHKVEDLRFLGERLPAPLMAMVDFSTSFSGLGLPQSELVQLGYRLLVDSITPFAAMFRALQACYRGLREVAPDEAATSAAFNDAYEAAGLERLLDIERRTVER